MHEVHVLCACEDIERCSFERYIADVRIAYSELAHLRTELEAIKRLWVPGYSEIFPNRAVA